MSHTEGQEEFLKMLRAHLHTVQVCQACASTTRDLAAEVMRGGLPRRDDLERTVEEAERVLAESTDLRGALERALAELEHLP